MRVHDRKRFKYIWKVGDILKLKHDIKFGADTLRKGTIIRIYSRNQGYRFNCLKPAYWGHNRWRITNPDAFEEITVREWIQILNDPE